MSNGENFMAITMRIAALLCLSAALSFAGTWWGTLVDSKCWDAEERNVNPTDTETSVDRDQNQEIQYCHPSAKTKSFVVVQHDGLSFRLDPAGNVKAAELVQRIGKKSAFAVVITGEMSKNTIKVDSISMAK
jgi:hypothetical protein